MASNLVHPPRRRTPLAALAPSALVASGCAGVTRIPLTDAQRTGGVGAVKTVVGVAQQELGVSIVASQGGAGFGLVGALVDASVNKSRAKGAEEAVAPVRNALVSYEAGPALRAALAKELAPLPWLKGNAVEARQLADTKQAVAALVQESKTDVVLLVQADYRLTPQFDAMVITAKVSLLGKAPAAPAEGQPAGPPRLYFNTVWTQATLPGWSPEQKATLADAAARWAADGGKLARRALDGGIAELARMIAFDLAQGGPPGATSASAPYAEPPQAKVLTAAGSYANGVAKGFVVREENGRAWLRLASGELSAVGELVP